MNIRGTTPAFVMGWPGHGEKFETGVGQFSEERDLPVQVMSAHSMIHLRFQRGLVLTTRNIYRSLARAEKEFYTRRLIECIMIPSDHLALTPVMHTELEIEQVLQAIYQSLQDTEAFTTEVVS